MSSVNPAQMLKSDMAIGESVYRSNCVSCHGESKDGKPPVIPSLIDISQRMPEAQIVKRIQEGKGAMPAFPGVQAQMLDALLRYLGLKKPLSLLDEQYVRESEADKQEPYVFAGYRRFDDPDGYPAVVPPWGTLNAIDLNTGKYLWKIPFGEYPELVAKGMTKTGSENYGGPVVTAGGILIIAATSHDRKIHAYNSSTGKLLWEATLPFDGVATPSTYMVDGKQYIVIGTCGVRDPKGPQGAAYVTFALP
jgi:quinoprotein glucose dehydrogenase